MNYWHKIEDIPEGTPRYTGLIHYCEGTWGSARRATWDIRDGEFAVEDRSCRARNPNTGWLCKYGTWYIFREEDGYLVNVLPSGLVFSADVNYL